MSHGNPSTRKMHPLAGEAIALLAVVLLAAMSWRLVSDAATAMYLQFGELGDPPLHAVAVPGPDPFPGQGVQEGARPSHLGHYGYFWSERAFHYRTALMFAVDDYQDPSRLSSDTWQQHPEGVDAWREYTLLMEPVYGLLYRLAGDQSRPFVEFLLKMVPLIHVLLFFALFGAARLAGAGRLAAVLGVAFYASCTLGFQRLAGSLLLKENFALLMLGGFLAAHAWVWRRPRWPRLAVAGVMLAATLASWHLSQFLLLVVLAASAYAAVVKRPVEGGPGLAVPAAYLIASAAAGLTPSLWERGFLWSPTIAVLVAWLAAAWLARRRPALGAGALLGILAGLAVVLTGLSLLNRVFGGDYNHVLGLLANKVRFGFTKPDDPSLLPFDVRIFWTEPFHSPGLGEIRAKLGLHVLWIPVVTVWALAAGLRDRSGRAAGAFLLCIPAFLALWLLIERMGVVFLPFAAIGMALLADRADLDLRRRGSSPFLAALGVAVVFLVTPVLNLGGNLGNLIAVSRDLQAGRPVKLGATDQDTWLDSADLFRWITSGTPGPGSPGGGEPAAFLAKVGLSPQLLLYAERPVVLNSQFENREIRRRYETFLQLLFGRDEEALWRFATDLDADFLVTDRHVAGNDGTGSSAYLAGHGGRLESAMVAVRMHLDPGSLRRFRPVYDNAYFRVLAVLRPDGSWPPFVPGSAHSAWWNPRNFTVTGGELADLAGDRRRLGEFLAQVSAVQQAQDRMLENVERKWRQGRRGTERPRLMDLHRRLVQAKLDLWSGQASDPEAQTGIIRQLENQVRARLSEIEPGSGRSLGSALAALAGGGTGAGPGLVELLDGRGAEPLHRAAAGQLLALAGWYAEASVQFAQAAAFFDDPVTGALPERPDRMTWQLWTEVVWWKLGSGDVAGARELAGRYRTGLTRAGIPAGIFDQVAAISQDFD